MKLADISNGPDWVLWIVCVLLAIVSVMLLSGHGAWLIAGYNTAAKEEKAKYDEKKLCRVTGIGMSVITVLVLIMGLCEEILPAGFAYVSLGIILIDCVGMIIAGNTVCRK